MRANAHSPGQLPAGDRECGGPYSKVSLALSRRKTGRKCVQIHSSDKFDAELESERVLDLYHGIPTLVHSFAFSLTVAHVRWPLRLVALSSIIPDCVHRT